MTNDEDEPMFWLPIEDLEASIQSAIAANLHLEDYMDMLTPHVAQAWLRTVVKGYTQDALETPPAQQPPADDQVPF